MNETTTPLDAAHAAMQAAPEDAAARVRFFEQLADAELFLVLSEEAQGETMSPEMFELDEGRFVLAFDREDRFAAFTGRVTAHAVLPGRALAAMLAERGIGLGLNLDVAPSAILIPADALAWLRDTLGHVPAEIEARIAGFEAPHALPDALVAALESRLSGAGGLARSAWLAGVRYADGATGHMLGFVDARPEVHGALAGAAGEAVIFSGQAAGTLDVGFFAEADPLARDLQRAGRAVALPRPEPRRPRAHAAPGSDPDKPPILR
ncbi:MAG: SseB family protein [Jhaorihella sp.]